MPSLGSLIYSGTIPLVTMWISALLSLYVIFETLTLGPHRYLTIFTGYFFARKDMFSQAAAKSTSLVTINLALPALLFSSIVPAFTAANISAIGPLMVLAVTYILVGLLFGLVIREVCYVPRNFWQGIVVASGLSNWSSMRACPLGQEARGHGLPLTLFPLATAVVVSITQSNPFDPAKDTNCELFQFSRQPTLIVDYNEVGVSFVSIFILVYHIFFWVGGLAHSLSWDYAPGVPQGGAANVRVSWREKPIGGFVWKHMLKMAGWEDEGRDPKSADSQSNPHAQVELEIRHPPKARDGEASIEAVRRTPPCSAFSSQGFSDQPYHTYESQATPPVPAPTRPTVPSLSRRVLTTIAVVITPVSVIVAISLFIALLDPLKALFVSVEGGPLWRGPDGKPPLAFVIDTGSFVSPPPSVEFSDGLPDHGKPSS